MDNSLHVAHTANSVPPNQALVLVRWDYLLPRACRVIIMMISPTSLLVPADRRLRPGTGPIRPGRTRAWTTMTNRDWQCSPWTRTPRPAATSNLKANRASISKSGIDYLMII